MVPIVTASMPAGSAASTRPSVPLTASDGAFSDGDRRRSPPEPALVA